MTNQVDANDRRVRYTYTTGAQVFDYDFPLDDAANMAFYINTAEDPVDAADIVVDLDAKTVTYTPGTLVNGDIVVLEGLEALARTRGYPRRGGLDSSLINTDVNNIYYALQEMRRDIGRALTLVKSAPNSVNATIPAPEATKMIIGNADATGFVNGPSSTDVAAVALHLAEIDITSDNISVIIDVAADLNGANTIGAALGYASTATTQAGISTTQAGIATAKAVLTAADVVLTHADAATVAADKATVIADMGTVAADKAIVIADMATVAADKAIVIADMATVAADKAIVIADMATTLGYKNAADADVVLTHADVVATAADRVQTGLDRVATAADVVSTAASAATSTTQAGIASAAAAAVVTAAIGLANKWLYASSTVMGAPGTGNFRLNNASIGSATQIAISALSGDSGNPNLNGFINTWDDSTHSPKGIIRIEKDATNFVILGVSGALTDNTTWLQIPVTVIASAGSFVATDATYVGFTPYGNDGTGTGTVTTTGSPASGNLAKFSGTTSVTSGDLSGDVTTAGALATTIANNAITTVKINNAAVTLAKIANAAANSKLLGAGAAGSGAAYVELTLGTNLSMSGTTLNASGGGATSLDGLSDVVYDTSTDHNLIIGSNTAPATGAQFNTIVGEGAFAGTTTSAADKNTIFGYQAGAAITSGSSITAIGQQAGKFITTATQNTLIGDGAGNGNNSGTAFVSGSANLIVGTNADVNSASAAGRIVIGHNAIGTTDHVAQMGDDGLTQLTVGTANTASVKALNVPKMYIKSTGATGSRVNAGSFNVTSITDTGVGDFSAVVTTNFADTNYCISLTAELTATTYAVANDRKMYIRNGGQSVSTIRMNCIDGTATTNLVKDPSGWHCSALGKQ